MIDSTGHYAMYDPGEPDEYREPDPRAEDAPVLHELADVLNRLAALLEERRGEGGTNSLAIEDMAKGPPKIITKVYGGEPLARGQIDAILESHAYAHREAERRSLENWAATVDVWAR